jgi:lipopolysaccharide export LptBFGC system permease protein LptF
MAAWLNRIPTGAWVLMVLIAVFSNLLLGYRERSSGRVALLVLPVIASIAFYLIADIDSPYVGVISVFPHNLIATSEAMRSHH